ncbi:hypothetical protein ABIA25_001332 [Sinorhizobium fredii]
MEGSNVQIRRQRRGDYSPKRMKSTLTRPKTTMHCRMNMGQSCDISLVLSRAAADKA